MGLDNTQQAELLGISVFLLALGTASAAIPDFMPTDIRIPLAIVLWFCSIIGFALKEALGGQPQQSQETRQDLSRSNDAIYEITLDLRSLRDQVTRLAETHPQTEPPPEPPKNPSTDSETDLASQNVT